MYHCCCGHDIQENELYLDAYGAWCPDCGNSALSGSTAQCSLCCHEHGDEDEAS